MTIDEADKDAMADWFERLDRDREALLKECRDLERQPGGPFIRYSGERGATPYLFKYLEDIQKVLVMLDHKLNELEKQKNNATHPPKG